LSFALHSIVCSQTAGPRHQLSCLNLPVSIHPLKTIRTFGETVNQVPAKSESIIHPPQPCLPSAAPSVPRPASLAVGPPGSCLSSFVLPDTLPFIHAPKRPAPSPPDFFDSCVLETNVNSSCRNSSRNTQPPTQQAPTQQVPTQQASTQQASPQQVLNEQITPQQILSRQPWPPTAVELYMPENVSARMMFGSDHDARLEALSQRIDHWVNIVQFGRAGDEKEPDDKKS